jgi:hypothetical protein
MKAWVLGFLLLFSSNLSATDISVKWDDANIGWAYVSGYASATLYDVYLGMSGQSEITTAKLVSVWVGDEQSYRMWNDGRATKYLIGKLLLGMAGGTAVSAYYAEKNQSNIKTEDMVFGALGGLTCIIYHF